TAMLETVNGGELTATVESGSVKLTDARGGAAYVTIADAYASNGVVHEVNGVLLPPAPPAAAPAETMTDDDGMDNDDGM
ncbi:MAG: fasciclin domain-containing protein, partial [Pacificimonas sp.]